MNSSIEDWKLTTMNTFLQTIQLFRATTNENQLSNHFNSYFSVNSISEVTKQSVSYSQSPCVLTPSSRMNMSLYTMKIQCYSLPNFFVGRYPIESLFSSMLQCFYGMSCLLNIHRCLQSSVSFTYSPLDINLNNPNETIEMIINRLMVDQWISNISYSSYYHQCAPISSTFQYEGHNNFYFLLASISLIYGGLSLALKLLIFIGLYLIDRILQRDFQSIKQIFICGTEQQTIHCLHVVLVITTLTILYVNFAFNSSIRTVEILKPSLTMYDELLRQSSHSLECPYSKISTKYKTFLKLTPSFHEVCSSDLLSKETIAYFYYTYIFLGRVRSANFLSSAAAQFQLLASFCRLSKETVHNSLDQLAGNDFINVQLLSSTLLNEQIQRIIDDFQISIPKRFVNTLSLIRETTGANVLTNLFSSNWAMKVPSKTLDGCSCALSPKCVSSSRGGIKDCLDQLDYYRGIQISPINSCHFSLNTTFESILNELMIEQLTSNVSYELYFNECAPTSCIYSYVDDNHIIEGITTLIGRYGGLVIICRLIAIFIVNYNLCTPSRITN
ncbi:unnamed protein product [Adineta ricciae]|nr:unnamed protein product [Adineta ricciae]